MCIRVVNVRGINDPEKRAGIVYVGRSFAGWPGHPLGNPFRPNASGQSALRLYSEWLANRNFLESDLKALWERTESGAKPLGCWCVEAVSRDSQQVVCHAQILAEMLHDRFCERKVA